MSCRSLPLGGTTCPPDRSVSTGSVAMDSDKVLTALRAVDHVGRVDRLFCLSSVPRKLLEKDIYCDVL